MEEQELQNIRNSIMEAKKPAYEIIDEDFRPCSFDSHGEQVILHLGLVRWKDSLKEEWLPLRNGGEHYEQCRKYNTIPNTYLSSCGCFDTSKYILKIKKKQGRFSKDFWPKSLHKKI